MVKVTWDEDTCIHAGKCVANSPSVFKVIDGKFTIDESGASDQEIMDTVAKCPSGALRLSKGE